jgi:hypothetical protein
MCKRIQTFWNLCYLQRESQSLCALTLYLNLLRTLTCVRAVIRIFRVTPNIDAVKNPSAGLLSFIRCAQAQLTGQGQLYGALPLLSLDASRVGSSEPDGNPSGWRRPTAQLHTTWKQGGQRAASEAGGYPSSLSLAAVAARRQP